MSSDGSSSDSIDLTASSNTRLDRLETLAVEHEEELLRIRRALAQAARLIAEAAERPSMRSADEYSVEVD